MSLKCVWKVLYFMRKTTEPHIIKARKKERKIKKKENNAQMCVRASEPADLT